MARTATTYQGRCSSSNLPAASLAPEANVHRENGGDDEATKTTTRRHKRHRRQQQGIPTEIFAANMNGNMTGSVVANQTLQYDSMSIAAGSKFPSDFTSFFSLNSNSSFLHVVGGGPLEVSQVPPQVLHLAQPAAGAAANVVGGAAGVVVGVVGGTAFPSNTSNITFMSAGSTVSAAGRPEENFPSTETTTSQSRIQVASVNQSHHDAIRTPPELLFPSSLWAQSDALQPQPGNVVFIDATNPGVFTGTDQPNGFSVRDYLEQQNALYHDAQMQGQTERKVRARQDGHDGNEMSGPDVSQRHVAGYSTGMSGNANGAMSAVNVPANACRELLPQDDIIHGLDLSYDLNPSPWPVQHFVPQPSATTFAVNGSTTAFNIVHELTHENINGAADIYNENRAHLSEASKAEIKRCAQQEWGPDLAADFFPDLYDPEMTSPRVEQQHPGPSLPVNEFQHDTRVTDPVMESTAPAAGIEYNALSNGMAPPRVAEEEGQGPLTNPGDSIANANSQDVYFHRENDGRLVLEEIALAEQLRFRAMLHEQHCRYARAKNENEELECRRTLIQSVLFRRGRFLVRQTSDTWRPMTSAAVERFLIMTMSQRCYVEATDQDLLRGRGDRCSTNEAHQRYLNKKDELRPAYKSVPGKPNSHKASAAKARIAEDLVDWFYDKVGRILQKDEEDELGRFYVLDYKAAVEDAKQKLREKRKRSTM